MNTRNPNNSSNSSINRDQLLTRGDLEDFRKELLYEIKALLTESKIEPARAWLRSKEVRKMLNISPGTLQSFRVNGVLSYSMIGKIPYYKRDEITERLEKNLVPKVN